MKNQCLLVTLETRDFIEVFAGFKRGRERFTTFEMTFPASKYLFRNCLPQWINKQKYYSCVDII